MAYRKDIIVVKGGRHKGIVKLQSAVGKESILKGSCTLDFKPKSAALYIVGERIIKIPLLTHENTFEVQDVGGSDLVCVIMSEMSTMVGGNSKNMSQSNAVHRAQNYDKDLPVKNSCRQDTDAQNYDKELSVKKSIKQDKDVYNYDTEEKVEKNGHNEIEYEFKQQLTNQDDMLSEIQMMEHAKISNEKLSQSIINNNDMSGIINRKLVEQNEVQNEKANLHENSDEKNDITSKINVGQDGEEMLASNYVKEKNTKPMDWIKYDGNNFYLAIKPQLDEMFVCYPSDEQLNQTVNGSRWVRIETSEDYYAVGLLYDGEKVSYICYGVPSVDNTRPPAEIADMCVWLPTNSVGDGYWVIYQSAQTGEIIK